MFAAVRVSSTGASSLTNRLAATTLIEVVQRRCIRQFYTAVHDPKMFNCEGITGWRLCVCARARGCLFVFCLFLLCIEGASPRFGQPVVPSQAKIITPGWKKQRNTVHTTRRTAEGYIPPSECACFVSSSRR